MNGFITYMLELQIINSRNLSKTVRNKLKRDGLKKKNSNNHSRMAGNISINLKFISDKHKAYICSGCNGKVDFILDFSFL